MQENCMSYLCRGTKYPKTSSLKQKPFIMVYEFPSQQGYFSPGQNQTLSYAYAGSQVAWMALFLRPK